MELFICQSSPYLCIAPGILVKVSLQNFYSSLVHHVNEEHSVLAEEEEEWVSLFRHIGDSDKIELQRLERGELNAFGDLSDFPVVDTEEVLEENCTENVVCFVLRNSLHYLFFAVNLFLKT